ncbi:hypothetical protein HDU98_005647 [Podochytrium sp. JEL0797]|nr:hypothetical protein HDU98_005647 [Podochytrium sp. JEL0797]
MADQVKADPAADAGSVQHINIKVRGSDGNEIAFKIKRTTPLSKLMDAYSNKTGVDPRSVRFLLDGVRLNGTDTPDSTNNSAQMTTTNSLPNSGRAIVKSVLSGDGVILRGRPVNGPPPERILSFSNVVAPRLGTAADPSKEELGAFESREYLRKLLIGKEVAFKVEYTTTTNNRDFGSLTLAPPGVDGETNVSRLLVKQGWVKVKSAQGQRAPSDEHAVLLSLEAAAQAGGLGIWNPKLLPRDVSFSVAEGRDFLEAHKGTPLPAIVDQVRDANTIRVIAVVPSPESPTHVTHHYLNINLTGIKAPVYRANVPNVEELIEPFSQEAKYFVESRLLQRDVSVILEGVNTNGVFIASLVHKVGGSMAEALVAEGYASVVSWQVAMVTGGAAGLKKAELSAKEKKLRIWKGFVNKPAGGAVSNGKAAALTDFDAIVTRIMGADSVLVVPANKPEASERRIFLSSVRAPPKVPGETSESGYNHEAKEWLRQKLIGKTVHVVVDFVKPKENNFDERDCATVTLGELNIAEALIGRGLATALRHRKDDDNRAANYDALLLAEDKALKALKGLHSDKEPPVYRMVDASESASKAKSFLSALQRNKTVAGVVEFCSSGSRFKVWIPSQSIKITLVLSGVRTPKAARQNPNARPGSSSAPEKSEPFGQEALDLASRRALQRDVDVSIEGIDKVGGFIGTLYIPHAGTTHKENFAIVLLESGFATIHDYSASQSPQAAQLHAAEKQAQDKRVGIWSLRDPVEEARAKQEESAAAASAEGEFKDAVQEVYVSEIGNGGEIHIQTVGPELARLEKIMSDFAQFYKNPQPAITSTLKVNDLVAAKFTADDQWYRARVRECHHDTKTYLVSFVDYGNSETLPISRIRALSSQFSASVLPAQAKEARLAFLSVPKIGEEGGEAAYDRLRDDMEGRKLVARVLAGGRASDPVQVVLSVPGGGDGKGGECLNLSFVADGMAYLEHVVVKQHVENQKLAGAGSGQPRNLKKEVLAALVAAQETARKSRLGAWRYGDFRADE